MKAIIIFCVDAFFEIGLGHLVRSLTLATELREVYGHKIIFFCTNKTSCFSKITRQGFELHEIDYLIDIESFYSMCAMIVPKLVVFDTPLKKEFTIAKWLKQKNILCAAIDDPSDFRLKTDFAFYPPTPTALELNWSGYEGRYFVGWGFVILKSDFDHYQKRLANISNTELHFVITCGGSDPSNVSLFYLENLLTLKDNFSCQVIIGPQFKGESYLLKRVSKFENRIRFHRDIQSLSEIFGKVDLALTTFGVTAYEAASMQLPTMYACSSEEQVRAADLFERSGFGVNLGNIEAMNKTLFKSKYHELLCLRKTVRGFPKYQFDGRRKIASILNHALTRSR